MTLDAAMAEAQARANATKQPFDVWEHTGGGKVLAQHRFIARASDVQPPKFNRWTRVATVRPKRTRG